MSTDLKESAMACANMLTLHNAMGTCVLDFRKMSMWTDFFIICSATSNTHMKGLARHTDEFMAQKDLSLLRKPGFSDDENWCLMDYGDIVVHIMTQEAREFYELEKLWFEAEKSEIKLQAATAP